MYGIEWLHSWGGMWFGPIAMIGLPVLLILLFVWLVRGVGQTSASSETKQGVPAILDERFARGEIDEEKNQQRRDTQ